MALFESYNRRIDKINKVLNENGIKDLEEAKSICDNIGIDPYTICEETQ
ncbi:MAG: GGGtGRT protein, partial [Bacteroidales bacterium]|nr:GGGtGRT protein [Bacteroidales bacterium]